MKSDSNEAVITADKIFEELTEDVNLPCDSKSGCDNKAKFAVKVGCPSCNSSNVWLACSDHYQVMMTRLDSVFYNHCGKDYSLKESIKSVTDL